MAAQKSKNITASCSNSTKTGPFSYANVVSNFKNDTIKANSNTVDENAKIDDDRKNTCNDATADEDISNKENECCNENISSNVADKEKSNDFLSIDGTVPEPDDDFIDYSNSKRKKKLLKTKKKEVTFMPAPPVSSSSFSSTMGKNAPVRGHPPEKIRPKRKERPVIPHSDDITELNYNSCDIRYVEAPVPKVNPWTVNKNAASVIKGEMTRSATSGDDNQTSNDICK